MLLTTIPGCILEYFSTKTIIPVIIHTKTTAAAQRLWRQTPALKGWTVPEGSGKGLWRVMGGCMWCEWGGASIYGTLSLFKGKIQTLLSGGKSAGTDSPRFIRDSWMNVAPVPNLCVGVINTHGCKKQGHLFKARHSDWIFIFTTNDSKQCSFTKTSWSCPHPLLAHLHSHPEPSP